MFHSTYPVLSSAPALQVDYTPLISQFKKLALSRWTLAACKLTISLVSAFDIYLTIKYVDFLPMLELNPIGRWLMSLDSSAECDLKQVALFVTAKFAGNYAVLFTIDYLASWRLRMASCVALGVAVCQLVLFYFLVFYEPNVAGSLSR